MTPERWSEIEKLFNELAGRPPQERAAKLANVEAELRREVEKLLASDGLSIPGVAGSLAEARVEVQQRLSPSKPSNDGPTRLAAGYRLGVYEIVAPIGAGGMGEVYRAHDRKLRRDVAVKILPKAFAGDPDRIARFEREAHALASLNHPNIAALHGMEETSEWSFLIMELVEGETLRGPTPVDEALKIARQIVEALETAHENGITHRDLKPGNIRIKPDGTVKVLDFGLAKIASRNIGMKSDASRDTAMTEAGIILGTAAYMSPEQARGMLVDKRADIWAFGVVLYELLTGKQMFTGESTTDILAAVVRAEPDWNALPASMPPSIRKLLKRCVEKDLKKRLPDIGVARLEIDEATAAAPATSVTDVPAPAGGRRNMVPWLATAIAVLALAIVSWYGFRSPPEIHWTGTQLSESSMVACCPRISPDGQFLAFSVLVDGLTQMAVMKPETGNWTILTHDTSRGWSTSAAWSRDGAKLYFSRNDGGSERIFSVPMLGGDEQLLVEDAGSPQALPDGSLLLSRRNSDRRLQLYRFWPESGRVQSLKALPRAVINSIPFRSAADGKRVIFFGKPLDDPAGKDHLYALDLNSEKVTRLAPDVSFAVGDYFPLAVSPAGESAFIELPSGNTHRIVAVPLDGSNKVHTMLTLENDIASLDAGADGSLYLDHWERPVETLRVSLEGGTPERLGTMLAYRGSEPQLLPLPDGRFLVNSQIGGRDHLLLKSRGRDPSPFLDTEEETAAPMAEVGREQVAFMIGSGKNRTIGLASLSDRRITRRLDGPRGALVNSMVSSPDGKTIYYSASDSIWAISASDGQPERLRSGQSVTVDPSGTQLIVNVRDNQNSKRQLVRAPIGGGSDRPLVLEGDVQVAPLDLSPNAVDRTGRIAARVIPRNSFFWPMGVIDPNTGHVQIIRVGYDADMGGGWAPDGKLILNAVALRASFWRFRPEPSVSKK